MIPGNWVVFSQYIGGVKQYIVGRLKDTYKPIHSGNIEYAMTNYTEDKKGCEALAEQLNSAGVQKIME